MCVVSCSNCGYRMCTSTEKCPVCGHLLNEKVWASGNFAAQPIPPAAPFSHRISPELLEWARQQFNEEEFLHGLREVRETGGMELQEFIRELEQAEWRPAGRQRR